MASQDAPNETVFSVVDPHHHFFAPSLHPDMCATIKSIGLTHDYLPPDYARDFKEVDVSASVHVEVIPDDMAGEVRFVEGLAARSLEEGGAPFVRGIVAACDLSQPDARAALETLVAASPGGRVKGVRWICSFDGALEPGESPVASRATWPRVARDFSDDAAFSAGLRELGKMGLSFDLQANPSQLGRWARTLEAHGATLPVVVDHLGHPRGIGPGAVGDRPSEAELDLWRRGMVALAALPHVCVKLSMLSYAVPRWWSDPEQEAIAKGLVLEVIEIFGTSRCMFASNWPVDGEDGLDVATMYAKYRSWVAHMSPEDQDNLFRGTATRFYRL